MADCRPRCPQLCRFGLGSLPLDKTDAQNLICRLCTLRQPTGLPPRIYCRACSSRLLSSCFRTYPKTHYIRRCLPVGSRRFSSCSRTNRLAVPSLRRSLPSQALGCLLRAVPYPTRFRSAYCRATSSAAPAPLSALPFSELAPCGAPVSWLLSICNVR